MRFWLFSGFAFLGKFWLFWFWFLGEVWVFFRRVLEVLVFCERFCCVVGGVVGDFRGAVFSFCVFFC